MIPHLTLLWLLEIQIWIFIITQTALYSPNHLPSPHAQCFSDFGLLDFRRRDSKAPTVVTCRNLMIWETHPFPIAEAVGRKYTVLKSLLLREG